MSVDFVEDVPLKRGANDWAKIGSELRARPNEWAVVTSAADPPTASAASYRIRNGQMKTLGPGRFESASRGSKVFARYVGD